MVWWRRWNDLTSALAFGGNAYSTKTGATETWNGTNWTEVNDLNTARYSLAGAGTATSALGFGGHPSDPGPGSYRSNRIYGMELIGQK